MEVERAGGTVRGNGQVAGEKGGKNAINHKGPACKRKHGEFLVKQEKDAAGKDDEYPKDAHVIHVLVNELVLVFVTHVEGFPMKGDGIAVRSILVYEVLR